MRTPDDCILKVNILHERDRKVCNRCWSIMGDDAIKSLNQLVRDKCFLGRAAMKVHHAECSGSRVDEKMLLS